MILKNKFSTLFLLASLSFFGQKITTQDAIIKLDTIVKHEIKISYLDSIKATFKKDEFANCIDYQWANELTSLDIYSDLLSDIKNIDVDKSVDYELPTELLKERLKKMDEKSPFNIEYNVGLENVIKSFLKNRKKGFERLMGISQFYFPLFEEELSKNNIPLEIKYLAVVESALNPKATSRVGATGLWQFMYQTGKQYGLKIDSYVDERSEPLKASQAASEYMNNMYKIFGDWDLVLAAYNSGPGNVAKAIRRSGGQQNYWNIRKNLPKETQGYLPAFLATMYIFEYHKEHGIVPNKAIANHFATDTIMVKKAITFKQISDLLNVSVEEIQFFNPSFKRNEIPFVTGEPNFLRLPKDKIGVFTSNEDKVYAYIEHEASKRERPYDRYAVVRQNDSTNTSLTRNEFIKRTRYHKVRRNDNLSEIASRYDVSVADLKKWNGLRNNKAPYGHKLKIISTEKIAYLTKKETIKSDKDSLKIKNKFPSKDNATASLESKNEKSESKLEPVFKTEKVVTLKDVTTFHKVKSGDNLGAIASKYDVTISEIKKWNKLKNDNVSIGERLKIVKNEKVVTTIKREIKQPFNQKNEAVVTIEPKNIKSDKTKKEDKIESSSTTENYYIVSKGDNLSSIARKNNVSIDNLKEWNNLVDNNVKLGTQLIISNENLNAISSNKEPKYIEHIVLKGEYLGAIARKYGISIDELRELNKIYDNSVKAGTCLIVGKEKAISRDQKSKGNKNENYAVNENKIKEKLYQVRKGDSLFSISKKFPGVSIADIKKWNNIKNESIHPGMKLKING